MPEKPTNPVPTVVTGEGATVAHIPRPELAWVLVLAPLALAGMTVWGIVYFIREVRSAESSDSEATDTQMARQARLQQLQQLMDDQIRENREWVRASGSRPSSSPPLRLRRSGNV